MDRWIRSRSRTRGHWTDRGSGEYCTTQWGFMDEGNTTHRRPRLRFGPPTERERSRRETDKWTSDTSDPSVDGGDTSKESRCRDVRLGKGPVRDPTSFNFLVPRVLVGDQNKKCDVYKSLGLIEFGSLLLHPLSVRHNLIRISSGLRLTYIPPRQWVYPVSPVTF